jgi:hypothetical protein
MLGKTEGEIYKYFTTRDEMDEDSLPIMSAKAGTALHKLVQAQQYKLGNILTAEHFIHNKDYNFTGHIDSVSATLGIGDVKTVSRNAFKKIQKYGPKKTHVSQVNTYMKTMDAEEGFIQYVMRDDPTQQLVFKLNLDEELFQQDMTKLEKVQTRVKGELASGELKLSQLRQGTSLRLLEEEGALAHHELEKDTERIEGLVDQFMYHQNRLEDKHGASEAQKVSFAKVRSNRAMNPHSRREDYNTIEGMRHGWFGKDRGEGTMFGSASKIGDAHSKYLSLISGLDLGTFDNQMGIDIETLSLKSNSDSVLQVAMGHGDGKFTSSFIKQPTNELSPFLQKTGVGTLKDELKFDFTKGGTLPDYTNHIFNEQERAGKRIYARVLEKRQVKQQLINFMDVAANEKKSIFVFNGNFEADHLSKMVGDSEVFNYSSGYRKLRDELKTERKADQTKRVLGNISHEELFKREVVRKKKTLAQVLHDHKKGGKVVEISDIAQGLQAIAQEKGLVPKTGNFAIGSNVENLADIFLSSKELHEGVSDADKQNLIAKKLMKHIQDIESGRITKENAGRITGGFGRYLKKWNTELEQLHKTSALKKIENEFLAKGHISGIDPRRKVSMVANNPIDEVKIFKEALEESDIGIRQGINGAPSGTARKLKFFRTGAAIAASTLVYAALRNAFSFSGKDDAANEIEGLRHGGMAEQGRKLHTDFGSGYQSEKYHGRTPEDPSDNSYGAMFLGGTVATGLGVAWNKEVGGLVDDLGYLGRMDPLKSNSEIMGRTNARVGDYVVAGVKRVESVLGGFPRSFGIGDVLSSGLMDEADYTVDITQKGTESYAKYMDKMTNRNLLEEGVKSVTFKKGKLYFNKNGGQELVPGKFQLRRLNTDLNQVESMTQLSKSFTRLQGVNYIDPTKINFIPVGGEGFFNSPGMKTTSAWMHETVSKYMRLMDDPFEAIRELFPDVNMPHQKKIKKAMKYFPELGVGGEKHLSNSIPKMLGIHGKRLGAAAAFVTLGLGTVDWGVRSLAPNESVAGQGGLLGIGAEVVRTGHQAYARISDATGMTALRDGLEDMTPGMNGWQATTGLVLSGAVTGGLYAAAENTFLEATASGERYEQFINNRKQTSHLSKTLRKLPGMKKKYTRVGKFSRIGALAGFAAALPWTLAGIGADQSNAELEEVYEGRQEVAVKKGRYWEASMTPWEGGKTDYYRPGWYARLRDEAINKTLYNGDNISPIGKMARNLYDPHWLEKERWRDQPYPYSGPDGSAGGIFGPIYEATVGRALKAPMLMHQEEFKEGIRERDGRLKIYDELGGTGGEIVAPNDATSFLRKQYTAFTEAVGLRGFAISEVIEAATGEKEINTYKEEMQNASTMTSTVKAYHDLQLGGGILTTEATRRVLAREEVGSVSRVNLIRNNMPSWMPGKEHYLDLKSGDPFTKIKEGYYRLPGQGYASRFEELKGISPEDYPDVFKYKILADVAEGSRKFEEVRESLRRRVLTTKEMNIYNQVEEQLEAKRESKENFRDPEAYETLMGKYSTFVTDLTRSNPAEQLIPFSPSHKFLGPPSAVQTYEESVYGKDFKEWSDPIGDFFMPAVNTAMNAVGVSGIPEEVQYGRQIEDYFDKIKYVKNMRLAEQAEQAGEEGAAARFRVKAERTMSGVDPYAEADDIRTILPKRERRFFNKFIDAGEGEKRKILELSSQPMRDIYLAQWDKKDMESIEKGALQDNREEKQERLSEIKTRAAHLKARRRGNLREFYRSEQMPEDDWSGWDKRVDIRDVKMQYMVNEGRDYHYQGMWKDRLKLLSRKPYVQDAAEGIEFTPEANNTNYEAAIEKAREMGIQDPRISILPGIREGIDLEVQVDRAEERRIVLKDLGYVI